MREVQSPEGSNVAASQKERYATFMERMRRYRNAPITEAIIDLRVQQAPGISLLDLARCHEGEEHAYPNRKELKVGVGHLEFGPNLPASTATRQLGFIFSSADEKQICQSRMDGFTFSRLAPYESWQKLREEARRLWLRYWNCVRPTAVARLAVRYVNRLDLPGVRVEIKDYLRTAPEVAVELPLPLDGFFMQLQMPVLDIQARLLLNETIIEPSRPGILSVVLDIDLFRTENLPLDNDAIWQLFEQLHTRKNEIFEACITDRARELFE